MLYANCTDPRRKSFRESVLQPACTPIRSAPHPTTKPPCHRSGPWMVDPRLRNALCRRRPLRLVRARSCRLLGRKHIGAAGIAHCEEVWIYLATGNGWGGGRKSRHGGSTRAATLLFCLTGLGQAMPRTRCPPAIRVSSQVVPTSAEPLSNHCRTNALGESALIRSGSAVLGLLVAALGRIRLKVDRIWSNFVEVWPRAQIGQDVGKNGHSWSDVGRFLAPTATVRQPLDNWSATLGDHFGSSPGSPRVGFRDVTSAQCPIRAITHSFCWQPRGDSCCCADGFHACCSCPSCKSLSLTQGLKQRCACLGGWPGPPMPQTMPRCVHKCNRDLLTLIPPWPPQQGPMRPSSTPVACRARMGTRAQARVVGAARPPPKDVVCHCTHAGPTDLPFERFGVASCRDTHWWAATALSAWRDWGVPPPTIPLPGLFRQGLHHAPPGHIIPFRGAACGLGWV